MTYQPLHLKYRPQNFRDLVGQETVATMLMNALSRQRIAPAYLFTGARGTGKTSSARIMAKGLNCFSADMPTVTPCDHCALCQSVARNEALDVVEIDAASNTGVDNMRTLIEQSHFQPMQCRYKVYIIDEVHMLSVAAFNALLKTLEQPPERVVFILATTDPQKVLPTITSRCQQFDFRRIPTAAIEAHLKTIAAKEDIDIDPEAVTLVAQLSQGGLRDAETLLDQLSLLDHRITPFAVWQVSGGINEPDLLEVLTVLLKPSRNTPLEPLRRLCDQGRAPVAIVEGLLRFLTDLQQLCSTGTTERLYASLPTTVAQLEALSRNVSVPQLQLLSVHLTGAAVLIRQSAQPAVWLERCVIDLTEFVEEGCSVVVSDVEAPVDLLRLWSEVVETSPTLLQTLLKQVTLESLKAQVATLVALNAVSAATVALHKQTIEGALQAALGYRVGVCIETQPQRAQRQ